MHACFSFPPPTTFCLAVSLMAAGACSAAMPPLPAFPGAVGYGRTAIGWRGGDVVKVTNTDDHGPGSLRHCLEDLAMPRVCIVETSGTVALDRGIAVRPNVYLAGQTAPGDGLQLKLSGRDDGSAALIIKNSHDVLIRNLKSRPGPGARPTPSVSALLVENTERVMLDHLSLMFATDQVFTVHSEDGTTRDVTLQHSIVAYGLDQANHPKGPHSKGALICSGVTTAPENGDRCGFVTLWRNLFAHNNDRNPDLKSSSAPLQVINNVFYNAHSQFGEFYDHYGSPMIDYIGNVVIPGPSTRIAPAPYPVEIFDFHDAFDVHLYVHDNLAIAPRRADHGRFHARLKTATAPTTLPPQAPGDLADHPLTLDTMPLPLLPADETLASVLLSAGDRTPGRRAPDRLDQRILDDVAQRSGRIIDHPDEVQGHPMPAVATAAADRDQDGMSDDWEHARNGLDPERFDAWADRDGDGWSNLEEYLNAHAS